MIEALKLHCMLKVDFLKIIPSIYILIFQMQIGRKNNAK